MTCRHRKARQGNGDRVCTRPGCPDCAHADLVTSCCLAKPDGDGEHQTCSECGTPCSVRLSDEQQGALQMVADLLAGDARGVAPDEPPRAWAALSALLRQLGVAVPEPEA